MKSFFHFDQHSQNWFRPVVKAICMGLGGLAFASSAQADFTQLTLPQLNANISTWTDGATYDTVFPPTVPGTITQTWNGVPFQLAQDGNGNKVFTGGVLDIPVSVVGAQTVYTLINSAFGINGALVGSVEFKGSAGADYTVNLVEGVNVRDHFDGFFNNTIDGITAIPAFNIGPGHARLDQQIFNLPTAFATQTLTDVIFTDITDTKEQYYVNGQPFIAAATVSTVPVPAAVWLFGSALAGIGALARRKQA